MRIMQAISLNILKSVALQKSIRLPENIQIPCKFEVYALSKGVKLSKMGENFQQPDASVRLPASLAAYTAFSDIRQQQHRRALEASAQYIKNGALAVAVFKEISVLSHRSIERYSYEHSSEQGQRSS